MGGRLRAIALGLALAACKTPEPGTFDYGERSTGVMEVRFLPGLTMVTIECTLFADGSVVVREVSTGLDRRVLDEYRVKLDPAEVRAMVTDAVRSGLAEFDADESRYRAGPPDATDSGSVGFRIDLDRLVLASGATSSPYSNHFSVADPRQSAPRSQRPELAALERICTTLSELHRAHERELRRQRDRPRPG